MKSSKRRILSQTLRRHWIDLLRRAAAAGALLVILVVGHPLTGLWRRWAEVERPAAAESIKPREAPVKVKGVRTIPLDAPGYANVVAWGPRSARLAAGGLLGRRRGGRGVGV